MRKLTFIMLAVAVIGGVFTSCKKDKNEQPTEKEYTVVYKLEDHITIDQITIYLSDCFTYDFTYTGTDDNAVEVKDAKAGWETEIKVKAPFTAKIEGKIKYNEAELPKENIHFSYTLANISYSGHYTGNTRIGTFSTKEEFLAYINKHPDRLNFSTTTEIKTE